MATNKKAMKTKSAARRETAPYSAPVAPVEANDVVILQTSPITIGGGGSVSIDFDHAYYANRGGGTFANATDEIDTVWVYDENKELKWELHSFVFGKDCTVTIHTKVSGRLSDIVVRSKPAGPLSVELDTTEFPLSAASARRHFHANRKVVDSLEIVDNGDLSKATFSIPSGGKCDVHIVNRR